MRLHPRHEITERAKIDLGGQISDWLGRHDLTWAEAIRILAYELASLTKYLIREERHPDDPDKKADEA
jgi:hypothetical protein